MTVWPILGILALILIVISFNIKGNTIIWRGLQVGAIIATVIAVIMQHDAINSAISNKIVVVCVLIGAVFEVKKWLNKRAIVEKRKQKAV